MSTDVSALMDRALKLIEGYLGFVDGQLQGVGLANDSAEREALQAQLNNMQTLIACVMDNGLSGTGVGVCCVIFRRELMLVRTTFCLLHVNRTTVYAKVLITR